MNPVVEVINLRKTYGEVVAVDGVSFSVEPQMIFTLVGPNGAGKTTTVECIEGLRSPDSGKIRVLGMDPFSQRSRIFRQVGVQLEKDTMYPRIRVKEALRLFASMYENPLSPDQLLKDFDLQDKASVYYDKLSGGQKHKLLTALALIGNPELVILDEPTTGLDPHSRRGLWVTLRKFREDGLTILLTTHNMKEAEEESDVVCIIDHGKIVAMGPPRKLLQESGLEMRIVAPIKGSSIERKMFANHPNVTKVEIFGDKIYIYGKGKDFSTSITQMLQAQGVFNLVVRQAGLEDLYLSLTGKEYRREGR
jgi:ABC-2 type transport system ATP-binding protein